MDVHRTATGVLLTGEITGPKGVVYDYELTLEEVQALFYVRRALANKSHRAQGGPVVAKVTPRPGPES